MSQNVIVVLYQGCISFEVALAAELLSKKFAIITVTPDGKNLTQGTGLPLQAQLSFAQVQLANAAAVLVPGGNPDSIADNGDIDRILQEADQRRLTIGAICAGPSLLAKAGILKGRRIAHGYGPKQIEFLKTLFEEVTLTDEPLIFDQHIITAKPEAHIDFAVELARALGVINEDRAKELKAYYRGQRLPQP